MQIFSKSNTIVITKSANQKKQITVQKRNTVPKQEICGKLFSTKTKDI
jgi:predicted adenine nucleotide alpha hydrolase (AANH) superfamily ATPase